MALPSGPLPYYVNVNRKSSWHVSALLLTALESMTLPSRVRGQGSLRQSLDEITGALNVNGNQNMAKAQVSVFLDSTVKMDRSGRPQAPGQNRDPRVPSQNRLGDEVGIINETLPSLDMDLFPSDDPNEARERRPNRKVHVFGEAETFRGDKDLWGSIAEEENSVDGRERARRRAAGLKVVQK
jgi:hypothetical protein